jgi:hypothetical protein
LLRWIAAHDLVEQVSPIQLAIRLLLPRGSRLLEFGDVAALSGPLDPTTLVHPWRHPDPRVDRLQAALAGEIAAAAERGESRAAVFERVASCAGLDRAQAMAAVAGAAARRAPVPYLTEPWYC